MGGSLGPTIDTTGQEYEFDACVLVHVLLEPCVGVDSQKSEFRGNLKWGGITQVAFAIGIGV